MTLECRKDGLRRPLLAARASSVKMREEGRPRRTARTGSLKRLCFLTLALLLGCSFQSRAAQEISLERGRDLLKHGSYKEAIAVFTALVDKNGKDAEAVEGLVRGQIETGEYGTAEKRARDFLNTHPSEGAVRVALGELQFETGRYAEAGSEFERAARDAKGAVWLRAMFGRARVLRSQGKEDEARAVAQEFVRYYNSNSPRSAEELTLIAEALVILEKVKDANELFIDAREADQAFAEAFIGQGELLNEKYNYGEAASLFQDVLKINPNSTRALVGLANSKQFESNEAQLTLIHKALEVNPNCVAALVARASIDVESDDYEAATQQTIGRPRSTQYPRRDCRARVDVLPRRSKGRIRCGDQTRACHQSSRRRSLCHACAICREQPALHRCGDIRPSSARAVTKPVERPNTAWRPVDAYRQG
jgi:tetratricopeptide (TPR) repeat protein